MKLKRFVASDTREAMQQIKAAFGPDAVILSSHKVPEGVEIVAAIDFDESLVNPKAAVADLNTNTTVSTVSKSPLEELREEILSLRHMVAVQMKGNGGFTEPLQMSLSHLLITLGLSQRTTFSLISNIDSKMNYTQAVDIILNQLSNALPVRDIHRVEEGGIYAFVGPTGVGKTTTMAKIAARFVLRNSAKDLGLITMDTYRIAALEQLMVYGKILDVSVAVAEDAVSLTRAIRQLSDKKLILIDTAGMSPHDDRVSNQMSILSEQLQSISTVLVLPATSHYQAVMDAISTYTVQALEQCVITKLDECRAIGGVVSALVETGLPVGYLTHGQRVPEDIKLATKYQLIQQLSEQAQKLKGDDAFLMNQKQDVVRGVYVSNE